MLVSTALLLNSAVPTKFRFVVAVVAHISYDMLNIKG